MTAPSPQLAIPTLDADGRVAIDAPCINCGYNLRTLAADAVCPECAHPVQLSIRGNFLCFSPTPWVRRLARGVMLVLIAVGAAIAGVIAWIASSVYVVATSPPTYSSLPSGFAVQFIGALVWTLASAGLAIAGLLLITTREPGARGSREGISARLIVRMGVCVLPLGVALAVFARVLHGVWAGPLIASSPLALSLAVVAGACWIVCFAVLPLALLRHVMTPMKRIPRPGLVLFARITFWGSLVTTVLTLVSDVVVIATVLQVTRGMSATSVAVGTGPVMVSVSSLGYSAAPTPATSLPATAPTTIASGSPNNAAVENVYSYNATTGRMTVGTRTTTAPTTMPVPPIPTFGPWYAVASTLSGLGACGTFGLVVAAFVLLILVQRALAQAARLAEQNAAIASAGAPAASSAPPDRPT